jgi:hypothetical protein
VFGRVSFKQSFNALHTEHDEFLEALHGMLLGFLMGSASHSGGPWPGVFLLLVMGKM